MSVQPNRNNRVAIIVTAREYQALLSALVTMETDMEGRDVDGTERQDLRAIQTLLSKCRDAGIKVG